MSVRNRGVSAGRKRSGGAGIVRDVLVMGALALLSFALGFFVLARLMPDSRPAPPDVTGTPAVSPTNTEKNTDDTKLSTAPAVRPEKRPIARPKPAPKDDGPTLEADSEPAKKPVTAAKAKPADTTENTVPPVETPNHVQTPKQPEDAPTDAPADVPEKPKRYRVQIGVYGTREKAEEIAQSLIDRGISVRAQPVGRLFRVQSTRIFRTRPAAEALLQKLMEAGSEGTIVEQRKK